MWVHPRTKHSLASKSCPNGEIFWGAQLLHSTQNIVFGATGIICQCGSFSNDTTYEYVHKYCHLNLLLVHPKVGILSILTFQWWNIFTRDWNLDKKPLSKLQYFQARKSIMSNFFYKEWPIVLGSHFVLMTLRGGFKTVLSKTRLESVTSNTIFGALNLHVILVGT